MMAYVPHTQEDIAAMLERIGAEKIEDLWKSIPDRIRFKKEWELPDPLGEAELARHLEELAGQNRPAGQASCFLGGGTYFHYSPKAIDELISRSEFYTAYTPYQPEISQGTLQSIFEFQTMVCELLGMEVANASMYDGAEAAAEAALMAERIRPKNKDGKVVIAGSMNPQYRRTIRTYLAHSGREIVEIKHDPSGTTDIKQLESQASGALAVVVQHPNYFGCLEDLEKIAAVCKSSDAVMIVAVTEALSMGLLEPPGSFGADIVVAEGQSLGIPMGYGGPHLGLFAARLKDVRKMPGRLAGETVDADGRRGFVLTLATREQHIRRAKATSNICTNQGLLALASAIYMTLAGPQGLAEVAAVNRARCEYLKEKIRDKGIGKILFSAPGFNEFVLDLGIDPGPALAKMAEAGILAGIPLGKDYPELANSILVAVTEMNPKNELDDYVEALADVLKASR